MKKALSLFLAVAIMLCAVPLGAFTLTASAETYTDGYYTYTFGQYNQATITGVLTTINGSITIPSTLDGYKVISIGEKAFYNCDNLTSVTIPESVTSIGDYAFYYCNSLTSVIIPDSVTSIGVSAFYGCTSLTSVTIGSGVTSIGSSAFADTAYYNDENNWKDNALYIGNYLIKVKTNILGNYTIKDNTKVIAGRAFYDRDSLTSVTIPGSVTSIGDEAFYSCNALTSITIPDSVTSIGDSAFANTAYYNDENNWQDNALYIGNYLIGVKTNILGNYTIKDNTRVIGYRAFYNCSSLTGITIPDSVISIGDGAFYGCTGLTSITIPDGITSISEYAFYNCTGLTSVTIPDGVTSIGDHAFFGCTGLTSITIPDGVTSIGYWAFSGCTGLTSITIPNSVTSIGYYAFQNCTGLTGVYISDIAAWCSIDFRDRDANPLFCANNLYLNGELVTNLVIPDGVTSIGDHAFWGCTSLTSVTIGEGVTSIGDYAFYYCTSLTSATILDSVTSIGDSAFSSCYSLTSITILDSVTSIGDNAFYFCTSLTSATIPNGVTSIGDNAFYNCTSLTSATILDRVTSIGDNAFYNCDSFTSITIPESVTSIGVSAFFGCASLETVNFNATYCATMGNQSYPVFSKCSNLTTINIGDSVKTIPDYAFYNCSDLTNVTIGEGVTCIGERAFSDCAKLTTVNYNAINCTQMHSINYIYLSVFFRSPIEKVNIGNSVKTIPDYAFYNCNDLTSVTIGENVIRIGYFAFEFCDSLSEIYYRGNQKQASNILIDGPNSGLDSPTSWYYECCIFSLTHNYENACDTSCNLCGKTRSITHVYDDCVDKDCNVCGETRTVPAHVYDHIYDAYCNVCGETRDATPLEWSISVDTTGVYALKPNNKYTGSFSAQKITVLDENGGVVKYNDTKGGFPLVKDLKYTVKFNYDCINDISGTITWSKTQKSKTLFPDTYAADWYNDAVTYAAGAGIITGYQNGKFGTSDNIQRQDFLVILARYDGVDLTQYKGMSSGFKDVGKGSYYEAAVIWGVKNGITTGYADGSGKFGVGDKMTREQLVTFLCRYAKNCKGKNVTVSSAKKSEIKSKYKDFSSVSPFSQDAIYWAVSNGVISGKTDTTVVPQGNAQRCEVAKIMYNIFLNDIF